MSWEPMKRGLLRQTRGTKLTWRSLVENFGYDKVDAKRRIRDMESCEAWGNDIYSASVCRRVGVGYFDDFKEIYNGVTAEEIIWISYHRRDRQPVHDWRDIQNIKNDIAGREWEAVEIFPSESRLVDTSNEYHLFAMKAIPLGWYIGRTIQTHETASKFGATQRDRTE